jgi:hypothetical protein
MNWNPEVSVARKDDPEDTLELSEVHPAPGVSEEKRDADFACGSGPVRVCISIIEPESSPAA